MPDRCDWANLVDAFTLKQGVNGTPRNMLFYSAKPMVMNNNTVCTKTHNRGNSTTAKFTLETPADTRHLQQIADFVESALNALGIRGKYRGHICVAVDEAVTNVILYAYPNAKGKLGLTIERRDDRILVEITDAGLAFNPLLIPAPDITAGIDERPIGGLGVHLVRKMMDETHYRRIGNHNHLVLVKHIGDKKNE